MTQQVAVKSANRAFEVLELFEKLQRPAKMTQIAFLLGYPQSSTSVLLRSLCAMGYLSHDPETHSFVPTLRVTRLGGWVQGSAFENTNLFDLLADVNRVTGESTVLASQTGFHMQYVHVIETESPLRLVYRPGLLRPICRIAAGLVMLALHDESSIAKIVGHINNNAKTREREDLRTVLRDVAQVRRRGYGYKEGMIDAGAGAVAMRLPVLDGFGRPLVVSVSAPLVRLRAKHQAIVKAMRAAIETHCPNANNRRRKPARAPGGSRTGWSERLVG